jgi:hypothetical protein
MTVPDNTLFLGIALKHVITSIGSKEQVNTGRRMMRDVGTPQITTNKSRHQKPIPYRGIKTDLSWRNNALGL